MNSIYFFNNNEINKIFKNNSNKSSSISTIKNTDLKYKKIDNFNINQNNNENQHIDNSLYVNPNFNINESNTEGKNINPIIKNFPSISSIKILDTILKIETENNYINSSSLNEIINYNQNSRDYNFSKYGDNNSNTIIFDNKTHKIIKVIKNNKVIFQLNDDGKCEILVENGWPLTVDYNGNIIGSSNNRLNSLITQYNLLFKNQNIILSEDENGNTVLKSNDENGEIIATLNNDGNLEIKNSILFEINSNYNIENISESYDENLNGIVGYDTNDNMVYLIQENTVSYYKDGKCEKIVKILKKSNNTVYSYYTIKSDINNIIYAVKDLGAFSNLYNYYENENMLIMNDLENNIIYYINKDNYKVCKIWDSNESVMYYVNDNEGINNVSIFDNENVSIKQYGGDQGSFKKNVDELLEDPIIIKELKKYFPDASMEDYELYLNKLCSSGCGYTAMINTIFAQYDGREKEFEETFGFPMYKIDENGNIDYNYEYLILDYYNYRNGNSGYTIQELYGNTIIDEKGNVTLDNNSGEASGFSNYSYSTFVDYLNEKYNINTQLDERYLNSDDNKNFINESNSFEYENIISAYNEIKTEDNVVIIGAGDFRLLNMDGSVAIEKCGGHVMTITGVTDDGNFIVSSWGKQYIFDIKGTKENGGNIDIHAVNYND